MYPREVQPDYTPIPGAVLLSGGRVMYFDGRNRRLGVGTKTGEEVGAAITDAAAAAGPAAPIVAAIGGLVSLISSFFGGGCGPACTESATLEQVPEVALDDLHAVALQQPGAISGPVFQEAWQEIISYGTQQLQALQAKGDSKAANGITNLNKSTDYTSFVASLPTTATVALDLNMAQEVFTSPSASGWEPGSVTAGNNLAMQVLQQIAAISTSTSSTSGTVTAIESATGLSGTTLLIGAALLAYFFIGGDL
jgi:hypothetical protein